jgi:hypothetical protein
MYAPAAENLDYIQRVTRENDFYKYMKFQQEILKASWTDEDAMWSLSIKDLKSGSTFEDKVHVFLEFNGPVRCVPFHLDLENDSDAHIVLLDLHQSKVLINSKGKSYIRLGGTMTYQSMASELHW